MQINRLQAPDLPAYKALMLHAYLADADAFTTTAEERAAEPDDWWLKRIADPSGLSLALGAFMGNELVGTVTVEFSVKSKTRHKAHVIGAHFSDRGRLFQADRGRRFSAIVDARGSRASEGSNVSQSSTISLKRGVDGPLSVRP